MQAPNLIAAIKIAEAGAKKMNSADYYLFEPFGIDADLQNAWHLAKTDESATYTVNPVACTCNCPFFAENAHFGVCKHIIYVQGEIEIREQESAYADMLDAQNMMMESYAEYASR